MSHIGIISAGHSNLGSLLGSLSRLGAQSTVIEQASQVDTVDKLIIPGVGSFSRAMEALDGLRLVEKIQDFASSGRPVLGICLGMQLLCESGTEGGVVKGLGLVKGQTVRFPNENKVRIPHVGWNSVNILAEHPLLDGIPGGADFYFVHSFFVSDSAPNELITTTDHGGAFPSGVAKDNVVGFQFHPEKSQKNGERMLSNFLSWGGEC